MKIAMANSKKNNPEPKKQTGVTQRLRSFINLQGYGTLKVLFLTVLVLFVLLPLAVVTVTAFGVDWFGGAWLPAHWSFKWFGWAVTTVDLPQDIVNTILIALVTTVITLVICIPFSWAASRWRLRITVLLVGLCVFPRMIPEITYAVGVARLFYFFHLENTYLGIGGAQVILAAPFALLVLMTGFANVDERLLEAAEIFGGGSFSKIRDIILPAVLPSLAAAAVFAFLSSYNDFILTLVLYGPNTVTMSVQTYLSIGDGYTTVASAISVILLVPSLGFCYLLSNKMQPEMLVGGLKGA